MPANSHVSSNVLIDS